MTTAPVRQLSWARVVGARALKQNASAVLRDVAAFGEHVVTLQGRPVATLSPYAPLERISSAQFDALLEATPESDDRRYELLFGQLVVSPSPDFGHQRVAIEVLGLLRDAAEDAGLVVTMDWSWQIGPHDVPRPDVLVCAPVPDSQKRLLDTPALVVEVTSTNRDDDLARKRSLYAAAGAPAYWVVDRAQACLQVFTLDPSSMTYPEPSVYRADQGEHTVATPFGPVTLDVSRLLRS